MPDIDLSQLPGALRAVVRFLMDLEANWPWAVTFVAALVGIRWGLVPIIESWRKR